MNLQTVLVIKKKNKKKTDINRIV